MAETENVPSTSANKSLRVSENKNIPSIWTNGYHRLRIYPPPGLNVNFMSTWTPWIPVTSTMWTTVTPDSIRWSHLTGQLVNWSTGQLDLRLSLFPTGATSSSARRSRTTAGSR
eukprot:1008532-Prorocentrum_minimum.AAC.4